MTAHMYEDCLWKLPGHWLTAECCSWCHPPASPPSSSPPRPSAPKGWGDLRSTLWLLLLTGPRAAAAASRSHCGIKLLTDPELPSLLRVTYIIHVVMVTSAAVPATSTVSWLWHHRGLVPVLVLELGLGLLLELALRLELLLALILGLELGLVFI